MNQTITSHAPTQARLSHIDLLKCIALYSMLVFHGTLYPYDLGAGATAGQFASMFFRTILSTCVPLFFFANGYLLFGKPLVLKKFSKKLIRMVLITSFWMLFLLLVMQPVLQVSLSGEEVFNMFWSLQMGWNNHLWYMGVLVCIYIFFPLLKQTYDTNRKVFYYFTAVSFVLTFGNTLINEFITVFNRVVRSETIVYDKFSFFHMFNPYTGTFGMGMVYFCLGGVVLSVQEKMEAVPVRVRNGIAAAGLLVSCSLLLCLGYGYSILTKQTWDVVWNGYDTVFTLCNVLFLFVLSLNLKKDIPLIRTVSQNTLGIYFMHSIFHAILGPWVSSIPQLCNVPGTMLYALALLALCLVICLIVKKIPVLRNLI